MSGTTAKGLPVSDAALCGLLFAVDPHGLGGVVLRGMPGPGRDRWLASTRALMPDASPWLKVPANVSDDRLLGGLDFAATIGCGKPVFASGLLKSANGGVLQLVMAERLPGPAQAMIGSALDRGSVRIERDGMTDDVNARFGVIALDEGLGDDERLGESLADRLAFVVHSDMIAADDAEMMLAGVDIQAARHRLASIRIDDEVVGSLCAASVAFGIGSARAELLALRAARALAALLGKPKVDAEQAAIAARLVLPPRARRMPLPEQPEDNQAEQEQTADEQEPGDSAARREMPDEVLVDAIRAAIPRGLLEQLARGDSRRRRATSGGRGGPKSNSRRRGRPMGTKAAESINGQRLNVLATLKSAAPWQTIRRSAAPDRQAALEIRREDLHVTRFKDRVETTTVFVVDASGSQAAQRLAEVKGAIELLLNECYVRRDQVALVAFRGTEAEVLLSPTRALARVKRSLTALPGGGGTPLAAGLDLARELAEQVSRAGRIPAVVLLTDGRANIARDKSQGAERAEADAQAAGRLFRAAGYRAVLVDTSRRPRPRARTLADAMGARYVPLPYADAHAISETVQRSVA